MSDLRKMARDAGFNTEFDDYVIDHWKRFEKLAELIKDAALAQPEQDLQLVANLLKEYGLEALEVIAALKTKPEPMLNGLTEEETNASASVMGLTRPQPVAWRYALDASVEAPRWIYITQDPHEWRQEPGMVNALIEPLYAPPQRTPLTEEEIEYLAPVSFTWRDMVTFARNVECEHGIRGKS